MPGRAVTPWQGTHGLRGQSCLGWMLGENPSCCQEQKGESSRILHRPRCCDTGKVLEKPRWLRSVHQLGLLHPAQCGIPHLSLPIPLEKGLAPPEEWPFAGNLCRRGQGITPLPKPSFRGQKGEQMCLGL